MTFLFTDVEGSTKLLHELGAERYSDALLEHRRVMRDAFERHGGVEVDTQGDAFFVAFPTADGALHAVRDATAALAGGPIRVRMGLHTGTPHVGPEGYIGDDVHLGARIASAGHGGQVLVSARTREFVPADDFTDLGEHRLKDFERPVPIFQLGSERFPPLKTISNTNLPRPASSFVGRDAEIREVVSLIDDGARLVTLTGPGGSGKTRLSIESAAELVPSFKAGVFWTELAPLRDPALVIGAIAQTLGAKDGVADHVGEREMLLVIDNFEQVIDAAPELAALVEMCPNLAVLVTSRERLRVRGEVEYPVMPLADPHAVELFCARARVEPDENVRELCRALDNLPLAIELAAARASALTPSQILQRLSGRLDVLKGGRDADPRQQTLRATIAWSYDLLNDAERRLFARLAPFAGCTLETAEHVADADLDTLQSLVEKSLVRRTGDRFWMLETIREFATEKLALSGEEDDVRRRHAQHFLALAEEAEPKVMAESLRRPGPWLERLEREHDNLRAALDLFDAAGDADLALRLAGSLPWFWQQHGHTEEARQRLERALGADDRPTAARAKALEGASMAAAFAGDLEGARVRAEEARELFRTLGDAAGVGGATHSLGYALAESGRMLEARPLFEEAARLLEESGQVDYALWVRRSHAWTYHDLGELDRARTLHEENLERARALNSESVQATTLAVLGMIAVDQGRLEDAFSLLSAAYAAHVELGERGEAATDVCKFGMALVAAGRHEVACELLACWEATCEETGPPALWVRRLADRTVTDIRANLDDDAVAAAWARGRAMTPDDAVQLALRTVGEGPSPR